MYNRIINIPLKYNKSFFLFGPRGTGKTTWLRRQLPKAFFIDLLSSDYYLDLTARPGRLENIIPRNNSSWIIIDEIQRIPELLNEVHRLIELKKYKFILTGSSARSLRKKGVNLLAGRALTYRLYPLTAQELLNDFNILNSLNYGHLPAVFSEPEPRKYLKAYVHTYLREEILQEGLTRNLGQFNRFLEIASFSQGSILNVAEIAREIGMDRMSIENYFTILEDIMIGYRIPVFTKKAKRKLIKHSKFYYFDTGVFKTIRPLGPFDTPEAAEGQALETLVLQELIALNEYYNLNFHIFYWRTQTGIEIDFVLYGKNGIIAIEVKRSNSIRHSDLKGLFLFKKDYSIAKCYCFYGGNRMETIKGINIIPFNIAFQKLPLILSGKLF